MPPGVAKLSVVALRNKDQSIVLNEYSRMVVYWSPFDLVMPGQRSFFEKIDVFNFTRQKRRSNGRYRHETSTIMFAEQLAAF